VRASRGWRAIFVVTVLIVLGARVLGPGDLYDKDQPKTMAGTADVALNGRWVWPRDMLREPATKPPMYNWLDAAVLKLAPRWDEWAFKLPSMVAALAVAGIVISTTRRLLRHNEHADAIAFLAAAIWVANAPVAKQAYLARPDMVMTAFLTGAFALGAHAVNAPGRAAEVSRLNKGEPGAAAPHLAATLASRDFALALAFWLCVAGAALSKGPAAIIPLLFVPLLALLTGRPRDMTCLRWQWGLPLALALVGGWALLAHRESADAFFGVLASEGTSRLTIGGPEAISKPFWLPTSWFALRFLPWSLVILAALVLIGPRRLLRHELTPAIAWVALCLVAFSLPPGKRADYLLPAYPAAAILAAYGIVELARRARIPVAVATLAPLLMAIYLAHWEIRRSPEAKTGYTRAAVTFARDVRRIVPRNEPVVFLVKGYHPTLALLRRYDGNRATLDDLRDRTWIIAPRQEGWPVYAVSRTLPDIVQVAPKQLAPGEMALYRIGDDHVTREALTPMLAEQYEWNFPPDRYRASRSSPAGGASDASGSGGGS
jgi:4-amino-4-deoxy-L-arabinose transferase-like glycosyltransferase